MIFPENYHIGIHLFLQLLGLIYVFAIGAFLFQIKGLLGKEGILPIPSFLTAVEKHLKGEKYFHVPSVFWLNASDTMLMSITALGTLCGILLLLNVYPALMLLILYIIFLSIVSTGQDFLSFGWEMFLLEITTNAFFLSLSPGNVFIWISLNFLLFRFHIQAGAVKLISRDKTWRDLTAMGFHYQTQPLPNFVAWYAYKLPLWFHKASTTLMFFIELVVPFGIIFGDEWIRLLTFVLLVGLQFLIWLTGNFSYLNHMTAVFCIILVGDRFLAPFIDIPLGEAPNAIVDNLVSVVGIVLIAMQALNVWHHLGRPSGLWQWLQEWIYPFHIVNRYGIFAVMTTRRIEIVIEGSKDGITWQEYCFNYKPSEVNRRPRRISPYQPRLDWQAWFLPFSPYTKSSWLQSFIFRLLTGSKHVLALLRINPFGDAPPKYIRALAYEYVFSSAKEKRKTGAWWHREYLGIFVPPQILPPK